MCNFRYRGAAEPLNVHHLGWVVRSIELGVPRFTEPVSLKRLGVEDHGWARICFLGVGCTMIELLEPRDNRSDIGRFLSLYGEGLHHIAYGVHDVGDALRMAEANGLTLLDTVPRSGARSTKIGFVDPGTPGGTIIEYVQDPGISDMLDHSLTGGRR
jgi:methylmalonyl-CoA/ethylmalonyl-CoA epimerase